MCFLLRLPEELIHEVSKLSSSEELLFSRFCVLSMIQINGRFRQLVVSSAVVSINRTFLHRNLLEDSRSSLLQSSRPLHREAEECQ